MDLVAAPPNARGFLVGQHGTWIVTGYAIAGWVGVGAYYSTNDVLQWRLPISFSCFWPLALMAFSPWVPESPRWLLTRNRREDAWRIVAKLHGGADDDSMIYAHEEFFQMAQQVQSDAAAWAQGGNRQLFTKKSYAKRMWMGFFVQYAAQTTGAMVIYSKCCLVTFLARQSVSLNMPKYMLSSCIKILGKLERFHSFSVRHTSRLPHCRTSWAP